MVAMASGTRLGSLGTGPHRAERHLAGMTSMLTGPNIAVALVSPTTFNFQLRSNSPVQGSGTSVARRQAVSRAGSIRQFAGDRSGSILIMFTLMLCGLALFVGLAVDVSRAVQMRSTLQSAADAAALAGVADFASLGRADHQQAIARDYMNASVLESRLNEVDFTAMAFPTNVGGVITALNIRIAATGRLKTTFLSLLVDAIPVSVESTATIPAIFDLTDGDGGPPADAGGGPPPPKSLVMGIGQELITQ
jgi:Flp pilus assembly protein TadG